MLYDITRTVQEAPIYPGSPPITIDRVSDMSKGAVFNSSMVTADSHMGTHADAYCHFLNDSDVTIDKMQLERYIGPCRVVTVPSDTLITKEDLAGRIDGAERLILHGGGRSYLAPDAARYIVSLGILTVVTDSWSVAPLDNEAQIHEILLGAGVAVIENVILDKIADGEYALMAAPIKLGGCDGAPVRAVLAD